MKALLILSLEVRAAVEERLLLNKLKAGEPQALEELIDRYARYVSAVAWGILKRSMSHEDAEEVASDVFLAAWRQANELEQGKVKAWLGAVARNKAKNKLRELSRTLPLEEDALELPDPDDLTSRLEREERDRLVRAAVGSLSRQDREIFLRRYFYFQSARQISEDCGLNEATVRTRLHRGREKLKIFLTREGAAHEDSNF